MARCDRIKLRLGIGARQRAAGTGATGRSCLRSNCDARDSGDYSDRSANTGSVRDARRAGIAVAITVIAATTTVAVTRTIGKRDSWRS